MPLGRPARGLLRHRARWRSGGPRGARRHHVGHDVNRAAGGGPPAGGARRGRASGRHRRRGRGRRGGLDRSRRPARAGGASPRLGRPLQRLRAPRDPRRGLAALGRRPAPRNGSRSPSISPSWARADRRGARARAARRDRGTVGVSQPLSRRAIGSEAAAWLRDRWQAMPSGRADITVGLVAHRFTPQPSVSTVTGARCPTRSSCSARTWTRSRPAAVEADAPGADDDASGVAVVSELARVCGHRLSTGAHGQAVRLRGRGDRLASAPGRSRRRRGASGDAVVAVMQLDMTNYSGSDLDLTIIDDFTDPTTTRLLGEMHRHLSRPRWELDACGYGCSDHASWTAPGYAAAHPFEARSRDINPTLHTARDTLDVSGYTATHAAIFARVAAAFVAEVAEGALGLAPSCDDATPCPPGSECRDARLCAAARRARAAPGAGCGFGAAGRRRACCGLRLPHQPDADRSAGLAARGRPRAGRASSARVARPRRLWANTRQATEIIAENLPRSDPHCSMGDTGGSSNANQANHAPRRVLVAAGARGTGRRDGHVGAQLSARAGSATCQLRVRSSHSARPSHGP